MFLPVSALFAFIFGSIIGSFLNVVIHRVPLGISVVFPGSHCPTCQNHIAWYDNVPILSWVLLGGKCRHCETSISPRYAGVEGLMGVLSALLWLKLATPLAATVNHWVMIDPQKLLVPFFLYFTFLALCVAIAFIDLEHFIIPHELSLPGILIGLASPWVLNALFSGREMIGLWPPITPSVSLIGAVMGALSIIAIFLIYLLLRGVAGMGGGDVTLMAMMGAWLGWPALMFIFFAASIQGLIAAGVGKALGLDFVRDARDVLEDDEEPSAERDVAIPVPEADDEAIEAASAPAEEGDDAARAAREDDPAAQGEERAERATPSEGEQQGERERSEGEEEGPSMAAIPFGPFIVLAGLEHFFLGPFLPPGFSMTFMYF